MNEERIQALETEVGRLNQIITVLLKQNAALEQEKEALVKFIGKNNSSFSFDKIREALPQLYYSYNNLFYGKTQQSDSNDKTVYGKEELFNSIDKTLQGNEQSFDSNNKTILGKTQPFNSQEKTIQGNTEQLKPLPQILQTTSPNIFKLAAKLKAEGWRHVEMSTLRNVAALLIHFYNKSHSASPQLRKLTGLSKGGLAKLMMSLKKRGFTQRTALQSFALTPHALRLMQEAGLE
jgi:hypothetical protein